MIQQHKAQAPTFGPDQHDVLDFSKDLTVCVDDAWLADRASSRRLTRNVGLWWLKGTLYVPDV